MWRKDLLKSEAREVSVEERTVVRGTLARDGPIHVAGEKSGDHVTLGICHPLTGFCMNQGTTEEQGWVVRNLCDRLSNDDRSKKISIN